MVEFKSNAFYYALIGVVGLVLLLNVLTLLGSGSFLPLIGIAFLCVVLFGLLTKKTWIKTAVRIWSGFVALSGAFPLFLMAPQMTTTVLISNLVKLVVGGAIFFLSKRYIEVDELADFDWRESMEKKKQAESREGV